MALLIVGATALTANLSHKPTVRGRLHAREPQSITFRLSGAPVARIQVPRPAGSPGRRSRQATLRAIRRAIPATLTATVGRARVSYRVDRSAALRRARSSNGDSVSLPARAVSARVKVPVLGQRLRNNCETAALQILLASRGLSIDQLKLQRQLPGSAPLDPTGSSQRPVWGDPAAGFVGRPDGGGPAGGFGVYERPVLEVARQNGIRLTNESGQPPAAIYSQLLHGHAVMIWVGLAAGPYGQWHTPAGRLVRVNYNEHAVVLNGIRPDGSLEVVNPLRGTREIWTESTFKSLWQRLGRRALAG